MFAELKKATKNRNFENQIELFELVMQISRLKILDDKTEDAIYQQVKARSHDQLFDFMLAAFAQLYKKQGDLAKAFLTENYINNLKIEPHLDLIDNLIELTQKKKPSIFEQEYLLPRIKDASLNATQHTNPRDILLEVKATILFSQDRLREAISVYQQVPEEVIYKIASDPFQANLNDCQENCPPSPQAGKYNRLTLAQRMLAMQEILKTNPLDQAEYYFMLGNAYYNLTYFGNAWIAIDYFRSGADLWMYKYRQEENEPYQENTFLIVPRPNTTMTAP
ncbi:MAG: hypothetical protein HC880_08790 [Bacteroidia bacterium]|nr:hypothetical protein [Bacteroidia bacterium]